MSCHCTLSGHEIAHLCAILGFRFPLLPFSRLDTNNVTLPITSKVTLSVVSFNEKISRFSAWLIKYHEKSKYRPKVIGTNVIRWLELNPGLNIVLHVFNNWPSIVTKSFSPVRGRRNWRWPLCFGSTGFSWVIWRVPVGDTITRMGGLKGHVSI